MNVSFEFLGFNLAQNENIPKVLNEFLLAVKPKTIIEIGTYYGGLSILFQMYAIAYDCQFVTFDIKKLTENNKLFVRLNIDHRIADVFESIDVIQNLIKNEGTSVVFCDGGNKIKEFSIFSKFLKPGDYILAHDYAKDMEYFENVMIGKIWNWIEITDKDIDATCLENNLKKDFLDFENVAITCRKKE
ncbi:MAG: CmcI family methyltransferase [Candidatus Nanoarchaeia archaeon]|jgi:cephalosporin hydroxylase|nr:CmcI family methyltransferase [Candidatus Nanoarchaeia archaeon]